MAEEYSFPKGDLMAGKTGLVMGVANHNSIAYGIACQLAAQGAKLAFAYLPDMEKRVRPLGEAIGVTDFIPCEVTDDASMDAAFADLEQRFGGLDFLVHSIAYAEREWLQPGKFAATPRKDCLQAIDISAFLLTDGTVLTNSRAASVS